ncbi:MAG TPA: hypothetical protein VK961_00015 [Chthoniobacter sp.]|nr:hypothetical protein [Chthoniobacter sp.]
MKTLLASLLFAALLCGSAFAAEPANPDAWRILHRVLAEDIPQNAYLGQAVNKPGQAANPELDRFQKAALKGERKVRTVRVLELYASKDEAMSTMAARWINRVPADATKIAQALKDLSDCRPAATTAEARGDAAKLTAAIAGIERQAKESGLNQAARDAVRAWYVTLPTEPKPSRN